MSNSLDQKPISLAQVGFSFDDPTTSLIGVRIDRKVDLMQTPRVVIMEPSSNNNKYDNLHQGYEDILKDTQVRLANNSDRLQIIRGDIYQPTTLADLPPLGLLVLENVLSDPYYRGKKDFDALIGGLSQVMINGSIVLSLDSKLTYFSDEVKKLIQSFLAAALANGDFSVVLSMLDFEWGIENIGKRDSQQVSQTIITEMDKLNLVDPALKSGLATLRLGIYHALVLQRN